MAKQIVVSIGVVQIEAYLSTKDGVVVVEIETPWFGPEAQKLRINVNDEYVWGVEYPYDGD